MIQILKQPHLGSSGIQTFYPALHLQNGDTGIGGLGRIDHAQIPTPHHITMHPHSNDEILSYFRTGTAEHNDSMGIRKVVGGTTLMLMKAGEIYHHEEKMTALEGLQIFVRPLKKDMPAGVEFAELETLHSPNQWRLIASQNDGYLQFTSDVSLYDMQLDAGSRQTLPAVAQGKTAVLYVYQGEILLNGEKLAKKDVALIQNENAEIHSQNGAELVLFVADERSESYKDGMFSGNRF